MKKNNNDLLPSEALAAELAAQKSSGGRSKIYKELSDEHRAEIISADVRRKAQALKEQKGQIDLSDFKLVQERTQVYLAACADAGTIPNVLGLASYGFGCSRQWLNEYMRKHPNSETTEYLETLKDMFADVLINASLGRVADSTMGIFVLKNCAGFRDRFEVEPVQPKYDPQGPLVPIEELEARFAALPDD